MRVSDRASDAATILLHGAAGSWTTWTPFLRAVEPPLRDVIVVDLPGWGESPFPEQGIDVARLSRAIREVALRLGYTRWTVVGHSLGGAIALDIAARFSQQTDAVVLVSPSGPAVLDAVRRPIRGGRRLPGFAGMLLAMRILAGLGSASAPLLRWLDRVGMLRPLSSPLFAHPALIDASVVSALAAEIRPRSFLAAARAAAVYDETTWRGIRCPVRSVRGARDVFVGPDDGARLASTIPDFRETVLDAAGHFAAIEQPAAVAALLQELVVARR
ncbi:putative hydrolase or acyltransferase [Microbacterium oleivorans]|uniref:Putative hydrolase or acyltransferase n=1 Tax=Microbacterium oleivorans TaxID=273677 RepID=A0A031FLQ9_9MICO|nr:putative hydrolase or acyltransferase [Microbacterium oleivorans]